ncbi:MAG: class II aldolase/adducin family protein [Oscillospiraceae bacterium]|jgi:rhamnose utilization protein RhaD (predicted bifunctional aldolase and dehydrogenase)|nr:class II aldolase/adducin family protein [Oscillospiraceae bacterium]
MNCGANLDILVKMSNRYGKNEEFVLAGGGNTSYKERDILYVKGSGTSLAKISREQFVAMDLKKLQEQVEREYPVCADDAENEKKVLSDMMAARIPGEEAKRPSVESILHAMFPYKLVLHLHPPLINGLTCGKNGKEMCGEIFKETAVWVDLTKPGLTLAQICNRLFNEYLKKTGKYPQIAILQNHGIFVSADTIEEIDKLMEYAVEKIESRMNDIEKPNFEAITITFDMDLLHEISEALKKLYNAAIFCTNKQVAQFVKNKEAFKPISKSFTPDHIVHCKDEPLFIESEADLETELYAYKERKGFKPNIVAVKGIGFFALGSSVEKAEQTQALYLDTIKIATYAKAFGGVSPLSDEFANFILNWEVEAYRSKV